MRLLVSVGFASALVMSAMPLAAQLPPNNDVVQKTSPASFMLMSTDLKGNTFAMPQILNGFGCTGGNISPELSWHGAPTGTKSFVLTMFDPDAPTGSGFWHWVVANIPASAAALATGASRTNKMPAGSLETRNDTGAAGYAGPCPPPGPAHRYVFTLFAMKVDKIDVPADAGGALVGFNTRANALGATTLMTKYGR
jgi:Raf kinase inhibitor-like YbhB/YbcL family protein